MTWEDDGQSVCIFVGASTCKFVPSTGAGFGTYTSVDFALLMDVLKNKQDHAKDIAVWHQVCIYVRIL